MSDVEENKAVIRRFVEEVQIAEGDQVVTKKTFTGVTLQLADIMRVRDGKIVEHWLTMDQLSFMQRLGVLPT